MPRGIVSDCEKPSRLSSTLRHIVIYYGSSRIRNPIETIGDGGKWWSLSSSQSSFEQASSHSTITAFFIRQAFLPNVLFGLKPLALRSGDHSKAPPCQSAGGAGSVYCKNMRANRHQSSIRLERRNKALDYWPNTAPKTSRENGTEHNSFPSTATSSEH